MQMMYETVYKALQETGLDNQYEPQDYLNFFCLGNREIPENEHVTKTTRENTPQVFLPSWINIMIAPYLNVSLPPKQVYPSCLLTGNLGTH